MRRRSFVAEGHFNDILALNEDIPLAPTQGELIPVQREILLKGKQMLSEKMDADTGGGDLPQMSGGQPNAARGNKRTTERSFINDSADQIT